SEDSGLSGEFVGAGGERQRWLPVAERDALPGLAGRGERRGTAAGTGQLRAARARPPARGSGRADRLRSAEPEARRADHCPGALGGGRAPDPAARATEARCWRASSGSAGQLADLDRVAGRVSQRAAHGPLALARLLEQEAAVADHPHVVEAVTVTEEAGATIR